MDPMGNHFSSSPAFCETFSNLLSSTTTHCPSEVSLELKDYPPWSQVSLPFFAQQKHNNSPKKAGILARIFEHGIPWKQLPKLDQVYDEIQKWKYKNANTIWESLA